MATSGGVPASGSQITGGEYATFTPQTAYWQQWVQRYGGTSYFQDPSYGAQILSALQQQYPNGLPSGSHIGSDGSVNVGDSAGAQIKGDLTDTAILGVGTLGLNAAVGALAPATAGAATTTGAGVGAATTGVGAAATAAAASTLIPATAIGAGAQIYGAKKQSNAATTAANIQANANTQAAQLQAQSAAAALQFEQQQAATAQQNYLGTQAFNRNVYNTQQTNLAPYRAAGAGSLADLARPIGQ